MDFDVDDLDDPPAEIVQAPPAAAKLATQDRSAQLRAIEEEIFVQQASVVEAIANFAEVDPNEQSPSPEMIQKYGINEAIKRHRIALEAWRPASKAAVGLSLATKAYVGMAKARATASQAAPQLNVAVSFVFQPMAEYETKKVGGR